MNHGGLGGENTTEPNDTRKASHARLDAPRAFPSFRTDRMMIRPFLVLTLVVAAPLASAQIMERVSVDSAGTQGNNFSTDSSLSEDGRFVAFHSAATNLVPGDTNGAFDVFVHDRSTGVTTRVSVDSAGIEGNGLSLFPALSNDGRFVTFHSAATNLDPAATDTTLDIYRHDRQTGATILVSRSVADGNLDSFWPRVSADGQLVVFVSAATNLVGGDTNGTLDVFVRDLVAGTTSRVSVDSAGNQGTGTSQVPDISSDGRFVVFESTSPNLVPGDDNGFQDIFVHDRQTGQTTRVSVSTGGTASNGISRFPTISDGGRYVAFESEASNLVAGDTNLQTDLFVHDRQSGVTERISVATGGGQASGASQFPVISSTGDFIILPSRAPDLVLGDTNGSLDFFVRDQSTGTTARLSQADDGTQADRFMPLPLLLGAISADETTVSFLGDATNLVPGDTNNTFDTFVRPLSATLLLTGTPQNPQPARFTLSHLFSESGRSALVLLSCSGTAGFPLPADGRLVPLTFDGCTQLGLALSVALTGTVDSTGFAQTPSIPFPPAPTGLTVFAAAVTIDAAGPVFGEIVGPTSFVTQ